MDLENPRAQDVARISLRLALFVLGVFLVVLGVLFLIFSMLYAKQTDASAGPIALPALVLVLPLLVIGGLLVTFSRWLALRLYGPEWQAAQDLDRIFLRVALIVLGVLAVAVGALVFVFIVLRAQSITDNAGPSALQALARVLPLLAIGGLLVIFSRWLAVRIYRPGRPATQGVGRITLRVMLIVLGVFVVVLGVIFFTILRAQEITDDSGPTALQGLIFVLPVLVIGGLLVTFSRWLGVLLYRPQPDPDPPCVCPSCGAPYSPGDYDGDAPGWLCGRCGTRLGP